MRDDAETRRALVSSFILRAHNEGKRGPHSFKIERQGSRRPNNTITYKPHHRKRPTEKKSENLNQKKKKHKTKKTWDERMDFLKR